MYGQKTSSYTVVHVFSLYKRRPRPLPSLCLTVYYPLSPSYSALYRDADKSLARPGRKQATATKLARRLTCFISSSVTRKALQFGT